MQTEQNLGSSLARFLGVRPPRRIPHPFVEGSFVDALELWPGGDPGAYALAKIHDYEDAAKRGSSENYVLLALADGVCAAVQGADAEAFSWLTTLKTTRGWMGNEVGSRDGGYWYFFLVAVCGLVRKGSPAVQALAWEWLDLVRFWANTGAPMTGQRSVLPGLDEWTFCDETMEYLAGRGPAPSSTPPTFDQLMVKAVLPELMALCDRPLANPAWKMATPVTFYLGPAEAMVVLDASVDANTIACLAGKRSRTLKLTTWAPAPPWGVQDAKTGEVARIREQSDGARCVVSGGVAHYTSRIFKPVDMPLPAGAKVYRLGSGSTQPDGAVQPNLPPPPGARPQGPLPAPKAAAKHAGCLPGLLAALAVVAGLVGMVKVLFG